jgi:glycosyltransferase involved in cell wall biosynthesis
MARATSTGAVLPGSGGPPLIISSILRPEGGTGVHTHIRELRRFLDRQGVASTLVTSFSWQPALSAPVFAVRLPLAHMSSSASVTWYRHFHELFLRKALRNRLRRMSNAVVYTQSPVEARAALLARRGPEQRVVMAVHFQTSQADEWARKKQIAPCGRVYKSIRLLEREVIPRLDGIVYVSESVQRELLKWLPQAEQVRSKVIPNFIGPPPEPSGSDFLGDLVTVGGLEIAKNHRFLLEVLASASKTGRRPTLDIYGDGICRKDLERLARNLGIVNQVRFRGFRRDVRELLPRYRVYVHASYAEASPFAIIEAMSAGLPIVAHSIGGIPELYKDGVEGRCWQIDNPDRAASVLADLLDSDLSRATLGAAAAARFRREFESNVVAPLLYSFLLGENVVQQRRDQAESPRSGQKAKR